MNFMCLMKITSKRMFGKKYINLMIKNFSLFIVLIATTITYGQEEDKENEEEEQVIGNESVVIVKAYTPTISDAFKIKATPTDTDSIAQQKKEIRYSIFSVPVASTFTPIKGKAANLDKAKPIPLYDNYATLGFGNYTSVLAEFYSNFQIDRTDNVGIYLHHNSSQGNIQDVELDNKFYNTFLDANYTSRTRDYTFGIEAGVEHQIYNWYGLPEIPELTEEQIAEIDPEQSYLGFKLGGKFVFEDLYFKKVNVGYRYFSDGLDSNENHLKINPTLAFEVGDELVNTELMVDFLKGSFERELVVGVLNEYQLLNLGINPSLMILRDDLTIKLGAQVVYSVDSQREKNSFFIYPDVTASYRLLNENVIAYGGIQGALQQNTYRDAVQQNPYVSPDLIIAPTNRQYDAFLGLKGKISDVVSYNVRGSYKAEEAKALFVNNRASTTPTEGYDYANSFGYRYDDVSTIGGYGELNFDINKKFKLGVTGEFFSYSTDIEQEAWNLPELKVTSVLDYQINEQWFAGAQLFFVGERTDIDTSIFREDPEATISLDSYFDANVNVGYRFNERLSVFVKGNNLAGDNYERWANFPVQGIQVLGGVTYKFNY